MTYPSQFAELLFYRPSLRQNRPKVPPEYGWMLDESLRLEEVARLPYPKKLTGYIKLSRYPAYSTLVTLYEDEKTENALRRIEKLDLLFEHFAISKSDPFAWHKLATALAIKHVSGLAIVRNAGRPKKITAKLRKEFYSAFIVEKARQSQTLRARSHKQARRLISAKDATVCDFLRRSKDFKRKFPELSKCTSKALQNLLADERRDRCEEWLRRVYRRRHRGSLARTLLGA